MFWNFTLCPIYCNLIQTVTMKVYWLGSSRTEEHSKVKQISVSLSTVKQIQYKHEGSDQGSKSLKFYSACLPQSNIYPAHASLQGWFWLTCCARFFLYSHTFLQWSRPFQNFNVSLLIHSNFFTFIMTPILQL